MPGRRQTCSSRNILVAMSAQKVSWPNPWKSFYTEYTEDFKDTGGRGIFDEIPIQCNATFNMAHVVGRHWRSSLSSKSLRERKHIRIFARTKNGLNRSSTTYQRMSLLRTVGVISAPAANKGTKTSAYSRYELASLKKSYILVELVAQD